MFEDAKNEEISKCYSETNKDFCDSLRSTLTPKSCVQNEGEAFFNEFVFLQRLKKVEQDSILLRATKDAYLANDPQVRGTVQIWGIVANMVSSGRCVPSDTRCIKGGIENFVSSQDFYKQQCGL